MKDKIFLITKQKFLRIFGFINFIILETKL